MGLSLGVQQRAESGSYKFKMLFELSIHTLAFSGGLHKSMLGRGGVQGQNCSTSVNS